MLTQMRQGRFVKTIFWVVVISFVATMIFVWGADLQGLGCSQQAPKGQQWVGKVGHQGLSLPDYDRRLRQAISQLSPGPRGRPGDQRGRAPARGRPGLRPDGQRAALRDGSRAPEADAQRRGGRRRPPVRPAGGPAPAVPRRQGQLRPQCLRARAQQPERRLDSLRAVRAGQSAGRAPAADAGQLRARGRGRRAPRVRAPLSQDDGALRRPGLARGEAGKRHPHRRGPARLLRGSTRTDFKVDERYRIDAVRLSRDPSPADEAYVRGRMEALRQEIVSGGKPFAQMAEGVVPGPRQRRARRRPRLVRQGPHGSRLRGGGLRARRGRGEPAGAQQLRLPPDPGGRQAQAGGRRRDLGPAHPAARRAQLRHPGQPERPRRLALRQGRGGRLPGRRGPRARPVPDQPAALLQARVDRKAWASTARSRPRSST